LTSEKQLPSSTLRYLTGALAGEERDSFEARLLMDQDFSDAVAVCEQELIDSFALGQMDPADARSFQSWIDRDPARLQRVRMARALLQHKPSRIGSGRRRLAVMMAVAACLLVSAAITLRMVNRSGNQPKPPAEKPVAAAGSSTQRVTPPRSGTEKAGVIVLIAERIRGEEPITQYQVHPGTPIELQVLLTGKAPDTPYTLQIVSSGRVLVERAGLNVREQAGHPYIEVTLPASSLPPATYDVIVSERENRLFSRFAIR
jgi:anti-sigma-K factor RskA